MSIVRSVVPDDGDDAVGGGALPPGGTVGQALRKVDAVDGNAAWSNYFVVDPATGLMTAGTNAAIKLTLTQPGASHKNDIDGIGFSIESVHAYGTARILAANGILNASFETGGVRKTIANLGDVMIYSYTTGGVSKQTSMLFATPTANRTITFPDASGTIALEAAVLLPASEALAANDLVNIWDDAGTAKVRRADAELGYAAHGYVAVAVAAAANASVKTASQIITGLVGRTPAARQYLGALGAMTETAPTIPPAVPGTVSQHVGLALSATTVLYRYVEPITLS